ncbi:MAG: hypothetical protein JWP85_661 [Rhodoglobus sp.]|nr:hypothetical protein [Rhodoglobus sp.]
MPSRQPRVGILSLDGTRVTGAGSMYDEALIAAPVTSMTVPGAFTSVIVSEPEKLIATYRNTAHSLALSGADVVVSNCGISMVYQSAVGAASARPTVMSSLLLLPVLWRVFGGGVGLLTYDTAAMLDPALQRECGWDSDITPVVGDVRSLASWFALEGSVETPLPFESMRRDLLGVVKDVVARGGDRVILIECTAMLPFADDIRRAAKLPVFDVVGLTAFVREALARVP